MIAALTNHLWQSTLFVLAAGVVAFALRNNGAHIRHRVWVIASLKFLVPFSVLMSLGSALPSSMPAATEGAATAPMLSVTVDRLAQPFADDVFFTSSPTTTAQPSTNWTAVMIVGAWACGFLAVAFMRFRGWRRIRAAVQASAPVAIASPVPVRSAPGLLEPGVVGLWRPVLLLPAGIEQQLTRPQLDAVLAHELCHVQRRDNLTAAIHMVVEAAFWFHPLVWFVGARLVEERERACDEHVLRVCREPRVYAESILNVCKLYVESPVACVSGVSGADLKKRIAAIVNNRIGLQLNLARRAGLVLAAALAVVLPLVAGMLTAPLRASAIALAQSAAATVGQVPSATFDVVSVKPCPGNTPSTAGIPVRTPGGRSGVSPYAAQTSPGHVYWDCVTLAQLVDQAYADRDHPLLNVVAQLRIQEAFQPKHVRGGPPWVRTDKFTIEAKSPVDVTNPGLSGSPNRSLVLLPPTMSQALRAMLEDRFQLKVHRATEQVDLFTLTIAKSGLNKQKMTAPVPGDCRTPEEYFVSGAQTPMYVNSRLCGRIFVRRDGGMEFTSNTLQQLATFLPGMLEDRFVLDQTGVASKFNFELVLEPGSADTFDRVARGLAELGLKIEPTKGPAEYLVIDSVQKPRPNEPAETINLPARAQSARNR